MSIDIVTRFIKGSPVDLASAWDYDRVVDFSTMAPPSVLMRDQESLLKGDQHRLWLRWFLEGLISPHSATLDPTFDRLKVYAAALKQVKVLYPGIEESRHEALAEAITVHVDDRVTQLRTNPKRDYANPATRHALLASTPNPRCYICGYVFSQPALDAFMKVKGRAAVQLPPLVDVFQPRGLLARDIGIEIDHIVPVAAGGSGQGNLRLACGWCNKYKSDRVSIYEAPFLASRTLPFNLGGHKLCELPNPFWTIRILGLRGKCQHPSGCPRTAKDAQLFVTLSEWTGSPNPTNLLVHCEDHDPLKVDRMQNRADVQKLWQERKH